MNQFCIITTSVVHHLVLRVDVLGSWEVTAVYGLRFGVLLRTAVTCYVFTYYVIAFYAECLYISRTLLFSVCLVYMDKVTAVYGLRSDVQLRTAVTCYVIAFHAERLYISHKLLLSVLACCICKK